MSSEIERSVKQFRRLLLERDAESRAAIRRSFRTAIDGLQSDLTAATSRIAELRAEGKPVRTYRLLQEQRIRQLIARAEIEFQQFSDRVDLELVRAQRDALDRAQRDARQLIVDGFGPPPPGAALPIHMLPTEALTQLTASMQPGAPVHRLLKEFAGTAAGAVRDELVKGMAAGHSPYQIARHITNRLGVASSVRAQRIVRTELMRNYRESMRATLEENKHLMRGYIWFSGMNARTCAVCISLHGRKFETDVKMATHPNCFPAGTIVEGPHPVGSTVRWYDGDLVDIIFSDGTLLSVTPNHPILTPHGWVAAGLLDEGSDVVGGLSAERVGSLIDPDDYHRPALIQDVAVSLGGSDTVSSRSVPTSTEDFHGDGVGSEISVIRTNRQLRNGFDSSFIEPNLQQLLCRRYTEFPFLSGLSALDFFFHGMNTSTNSLMSRERILFSLFGRSSTDEQSVRFGIPPSFNAVSDQITGDDITGNTERFSDGLFGLARGVPSGDFSDGQFNSISPGIPGLLTSDRVSRGTITHQSASPEQLCKALFSGSMSLSGNLGAIAREIVIHRVLKVSRRGFRGHVYNLQTKPGWYIANGIITHNCRCVLLPNTKSWKDLGYDVPDTRAAVQSGPDQFAGWTPEQQRKVLGNAAHAAYANGDVDLSDFVGITRSTVWGTGRRRVSLATAKQRSKRAA